MEVNVPLFNYKCSECGHIIEKFQHNATEVLEIECEECGAVDCEKQLPFARNRVWLNADALLKQKILPDAQRISDNVSKGVDRDFFDICGD